MEPARDAERQAIAARDDLARIVGNLARETADSDTQLRQMNERVTRSEQRLSEIDTGLVDGELSRNRLDEELGSARSQLSGLEAAQDSTREQRAQGQVHEAQVAGNLRAATERLQRAERTRIEAEAASRRASAASSPSSIPIGPR